MPVLVSKFMCRGLCCICVHVATVGVFQQKPLVLHAVDNVLYHYVSNIKQERAFEYITTQLCQIQMHNLNVITR